MPLLLPKRMSFQPQGSAAVNWSNPITAGLEVAILHGQQNFSAINLANPYLSFSVANTGSNLTKNIPNSVVGLGNKFVDTNFTFQSNTTLGLRNTSPSGFTVGAVAISNGGVNGRMMCQDRAGGSRIFQFNIDSSNKVEFITFTGSSPVFTSALWPNSTTVGGAVAAATSGTSASIAVNGALTKATITAPNMLSNTAEQLDIGKFVGSGTQSWVGTISLNVLWSRRLTDDELSSWTTQPWQLFAPSRPTVIISSVLYSYARPASDITTQWTPSAGTAHWSLIDEVVADDTDYIVATASGQVDEVKLAAMSTPSAGSDISVNYKVAGITGGATVTVRLVCGTTVIATDTTRSANGTYTLTVPSSTWSTGATQVTDWTNMRLRFTSA